MGNYNTPKLKEYIKKKYFDPFGTNSNHKYMEFRDKIFSERGYKCELCAKEGRVVQAEILDHVVPVHANGSVTDRDNIMILCKYHNQKKTRQDRLARQVDLGVAKKKLMEKVCPYHGNIIQTIHQEVIPCPECEEGE